MDNCEVIKMNEHVIELFQPQHTLIGQGAVGEIPRFLQGLNVSTVLIVTDTGLIKLGTAKLVTDVLDRGGVRYQMYDGVKPNPTVDIVNEATAVFQRANCGAILAIGGGSAIDVAKAVSILSANGGNIEDYNGYNKSKKAGTPVIAVNTTAGTGSEVTRAYVVTDEKIKSKMLMVDANCLAYLAIDDPDLMVGMPPKLTAATGMDALTHAIEAYVSNVHFPYTDGIALEAIKLVATSLPIAVANGKDMEARTNMCWAEYMAGLAFSNAGLGIVHSIAHQLGGYYNIPHGLANAMLLPRVMEYNRPYCVERMADIAKAMGVKTDNMSAEQASYAAIAAVRKLSETVKIGKLHETNFSLDDLSVLADHALKDTSTPTNPVQPSQKDIEEILAKTYIEGLILAKMGK